MKISLCSKKSDPSTIQVDATPQEIHTYASPLPKESAPLWSPCTFKNGTRLEADAVEVSALVYDFDNGRADIPLAKVGVTHVWHTSASHTPEAPKWRLIIPLDRPVPAKQWPEFWEKTTTAMGLAGLADAACKNVGRFYFVPPAACDWEAFEGKPLPVGDLEKAPSVTDMSVLRKQLLALKHSEYSEHVRKALAHEPIAGAGARDSTVTALGFYIGRHLSQETSVAAVLQLLTRGLLLPGTESHAHWVKKFEAAFGRGKAKSAEVAAESMEAQGLNAEWAKALQTATRLDGSVQVLNNAYNAGVIIRNAPWRFRHNLLEDTIEFASKDEDFKALGDTDVTDIGNWLQKTYRVGVNRNVTYDQIAAAAKPFDPLKEYLDGLTWDGTGRMDSFLVDYLGVEATPEAKLYSRKWLIAMVARALRPGCKMDNVLVLQGAQGLGKSTGLRLMGAPWFSDSKVTVGDKDSLLSASRFWLHEFGELASLKRADLDTMNAFFTSTTDSFRPPYGRATVVRARRCVFVATTNESEFLTDPNGTRRFWVVECVNKVDFSKIENARDQLFAEAVEALKAGEKWWIDTDAEQKIQRESSANYSVSVADSARGEAIRQWWEARPFAARPLYLTAGQVLQDIWNVPLERCNGIMNADAARMLKALGWVRCTPSVDGHRVRAYKPPLSWERMPQRIAGKVVDLKSEDKGTGT